MKGIDLLGQAISILAMAFNILSYQNKSQRAVITFQLFGSALFSLSFFLLASPMGAILNLIGAVRCIVYRYRERLHADKLAWLIGFISLYLLSYVATFTLLDTPPTAKNLLLELLPVIGMSATNISFRLHGARIVRLLGLVSSPCWLIYNISAGSLGAILCEVISLISIIIGILRLDLKKPAPTPEEAPQNTKDYDIRP